MAIYLWAQVGISVREDNVDIKRSVERCQNLVLFCMWTKAVESILNVLRAGGDWPKTLLRISPGGSMTRVTSTRHFG